MQPNLLPEGPTYPRTGAITSDTVDVADVVRTMRRQWRAVAGFTAAGLVLGLAVVLFAPRRFDGQASLLARPGSQGGSAIGSRISGLGELLGGLGGLGVGGSLETELQVLRSRALTGQVVDSLQLQIRVLEPEGAAPMSLVASSDLPGVFAPRRYAFTRTASGTYRAEREGQVFELTPGTAGRLDIGSITLRPMNLPAAFELRLMDREDAITRFDKKLAVTKAGGEIAKIVYRGDDSLSAAAGANALVKFYLDRRKSADRGVNARRVEYVTEQLQATGAELAKTESDLRKYQERSGVFDAEVLGQVELQALAEIRLAFTQVQVNEAAIQTLLAQAESGRITSRDLAAHPAFLEGSAVTPLAQQLGEVEAQRIRLLERRTERDPEVLALDSTARLISNNILGVARSYGDAVTRQRQQMQTRVDSIERSLLALPAAAEVGGRLQRDVRRLTTIYTALEAQLVEARLAAIGEGGDVRQVDVAVPRRKPSFPQPGLTMGIGSAGGLLAGMVAALFLGWFGRWLRDPVEIERAIGVSAHRIDPNSPLMLSSAHATRSVLVIPLDGKARGGAGVVAQRLARTAQQRAIQATVVDLSANSTDGNGKLAAGVAHLAATIDQMEQDGAVTVVQLPELSSEITLSALRENRPVLLVAPPGPVDRTRLTQTVDTLRRLHVPIAGVVISDDPRRPVRTLP